MKRALCLAALGVGLSVGAVAFAAGANGVSVKLQKESFVPENVDVAVGTKITWTNTDSIPHSATANDGAFDSGAILPGKTFEWTATAAGNFAYHCIFHPSMTAAIKVHAPKKGAH